MLQHTVCLLLFMSCLQKQCMLEPNVEHLHIVHVIRGSVVHVPIVPEINAERHATNSCYSSKYRAQQLPLVKLGKAIEKVSWQLILLLTMQA